MGVLDFFSSISCFFLLILSLHLFFAKRGVRLLNRLLSVIFISRFGQVLILLLVNSAHLSVFPFFYQLFTPIYYAAPACFYLYVTCFINGRSQLRRLEWFHFVPVVLAIVHILPFPFAPSVSWDTIADQITENKQLFITERSGLLEPWFYYLGRPALMLGYLIATWVSVLKSKSIDSEIDADGKKWILFFLRAATFFQLASFFPIMPWDMEGRALSAVFILLNCVVLLVIVVFIMHQPKMFYGYLFVSVDMDKVSEAKLEAPAESDADKDVEEVAEVIAISKVVSPKKIKLAPDQLHIHSSAMTSYMEIHQPYLKPDFQIVDLARGLDIPVHHCSFVLNNLLGKNFRDWINSYRIEFFIGQYPVKSDRMTIEAVAYESGFKSLATFYNAFKKEKGLMPKTFFSQKKVS